MAKKKELPAEDIYLAELDIDESLKVRSRLLRDNMSSFESKIWKLIGKENNPWDLLRQIPVAGYYLDFYSPTHMACIEADGPDHLKTAVHDAKRDKELRKRNIRTLRITPADFQRGRPLDILTMITNFIETED
jgi:very-short-patch-repair endonuclease